MTHRMEQILDVEGGIAKSIEEHVRFVCDCELEDLSDAEQEEIEEILFTCSTCGWTHNRIDDESSEDDVCLECYEEKCEEEEE